MKKIAYLAMLASAVATAPVAVAQDPPSILPAEFAQFAPAEQFGFGMFLVAKAYTELTASDAVEKDPEGTAAKIEEMTQVVYALYEIPMTEKDHAELQDIQAKLMVTPEYNDIQAQGAAAATKIKSAEYYGSERLRSAIRDFTMGVMGFRRGE